MIISCDICEKYCSNFNPIIQNAIKEKVNEITNNSVSLELKKSEPQNQTTTLQNLEFEEYRAESNLVKN